MANSIHRVSSLSRSPRFFLAWAIAAALLIQALAPLAQAWAFEHRVGDGEPQVVCTVNSAKTVFIGEDGKPLDPSEALACALCVLHNAPTAFIPDSAALAADAPLCRQPAIQRQSQHTRPGVLPGTSDSPRAPPASI